MKNKIGDIIPERAIYLRKMKKVLKYGTGDIIPDNAEYLTTIVQQEVEGMHGFLKVWLVWHYFLVEVNEEKK